MFLRMVGELPPLELLYLWAKASQLGFEYFLHDIVYRANHPTRAIATHSVDR